MRFIIIFSLLLLLIIRFYIQLTVRSGLSKKQKNQYKTLSWINRWFLWSAHLYVKDKFSKYEKKTIRYTLHTKIYRIVNLYLHLLFIIEIIAYFLCKYSVLPEVVVEIPMVIYFFSFLGAFLLMFIVQTISEPRAYKRQCGKR